MDIGSACSSWNLYLYILHIMFVTIKFFFYVLMGIYLILTVKIVVGLISQRLSSEKLGQMCLGYL
jgi:hypothetical protein